MKIKKVLNIIFIIIMLLTIFLVLEISITQPSDDIWYNTMDIALCMFFLTPVMISEIGIYFSCIYFFTDKKKTYWKTFLNILICVVNCALIAAIFYSVIYFNKTQELIILSLFVLSIGLRLTYSFIAKH